MTGWYPHVRGHRTLTHLLQPGEPNLLKYLKQNGYEVAWFGKNDLLAEKAFADSVDYYDDYPGFMPETIENYFDSPEQPGFYSFLHKPLEGTIENHVDTLKVNAGLEFLRRPHEKPFCLYLPLATPHCPFTAPEPYYSMYNPEDVPPLRPADFEGKPAFYRRIHEFYGLDKAEEWVFKKLNAVYLGTITMIDELIGRVLDELERQGLAENTTVLVHSDHGEWAGDWGLVEKYSPGLDDTLTRVPLVIRTPGGKAGHVVEEPVELFDQMATILDLADIEAQHTHFARSLVPQLKGAPGDANRAVFAEGGIGLNEPHGLESSSWDPPKDNMYYGKVALQGKEPSTNARAAMIRTQSHKLVMRPETGEHELYDLLADPQEMTNRYGQQSYQQAQQALESRLLDWYMRTSDVIPFETDNRGMPEKSQYWRRIDFNDNI